MSLHALLHVDAHFTAWNHLGTSGVTKLTLHFNERTLFLQVPVNSTVLDASFATLTGHGVLLASVGTVSDDGLAVGVVVGDDFLVGCFVVAIIAAVRPFPAFQLVFLQFFSWELRPAALRTAELHVPAVPVDLQKVLPRVIEKGGEGTGY